MAPVVEELPDNKVRITVDVPREEVHHAVEHAASDLAETVKVPGFRKGKVPMPVMVSRIGKERLYTEAIESHISGWFWNAAARTGIRPADRPELDYVAELGAGRLLPELEEQLIGMAARESRERRFEEGDDNLAVVTATVKEVKEKVLPPLDDELARAASEFDTFDELRGEIEGRL